MSRVLVWEREVACLSLRVGSRRGRRERPAPSEESRRSRSRRTSIRREERDGTFEGRPWTGDLRMAEVRWGI